MNDQTSNTTATHAQAERREIEAARLRKKRTDPIYLAREREANRSRMRARRERLHAGAEERAP